MNIPATDALFGGTILIGLLAAFWTKLKIFSWKIASLLIVRVRLEEDAAVAFGYWLFTKCKRSPFGERRYSAIKEFVRPEDRYLSIAFEWFGTDSVCFWSGWRPLLAHLNVGGPNSEHLPGSQQLTITTIRGLANIEKILIESMKELNSFRHRGNSQTKRFSIRRAAGHGSRNHRTYSDEKTACRGPEEVRQCLRPDMRILHWKPEDIGARSETDPWASIAFPPEIEKAMSEARRWIASETWFREKKIPWRLGWLLYGRPGTGKTTLARAIAQELDLPIVAFDLASFSNEEFVREWDRLMNETPCMAILEDMDAVFKKRENRLGEEGGGLTFDCLLNCISGVAVADGVFLIITTNKIEDIDEALGIPDIRGTSTRPGRIDRAIELQAMDKACRRRIAERILIDCPEHIEELVSDGEGDTGAQFQDRCAQVALENYWARERAVDVDGAIRAHQEKAPVPQDDHVMLPAGRAGFHLE